MHNNYYFLRKLSKRLHSILIGAELIECFSQDKDELVLSFISGQSEFYIKAHLQPDFSCLSFPKTFFRANRNTANVFEDLIRKKVTGITQFDNERSFSINFEDELSLVFKLFGNRSNLILYKQGVNSKIFKNSLTKDKHLNYDSFNRDIDQSLSEYRKNNFNYKQVFPTFGKLVNDYIKGKISTISDVEDQWQFLTSVQHQLEKSEIFYITEIDGTPVLSLLNQGKIKYQTHDPLEAINNLFISYTKDYYLRREKQAVEKQLMQSDNRNTAYIKKVKAKLNDLNSGLGYDKVADVIMANMHQIPPKLSDVELYNFYNDEQIKVKLNSTLSPQKNAENYYRKSKNQNIERESLQSNLHNKIRVNNKIKEHLKSINSIESLKELRKYLKDHSLFQSKEVDEKASLFKVFDIDGWKVYVGKNAKNNDLLTQKFSFKEDLWLHAKDVSGSHVLIKYQSGKKFPKWVIEQAAQLAAYYSQRKTDSFCPVIITPKKFVRKVKGSPPGSVIIDKEEVLLVRPSSFKDL